MKYAVGADHLVYGWFFFAIVLLLLVVAGETLRNAQDRQALSQYVSPVVIRAVLNNSSVVPPMTMICLLMLAGLLWKNALAPMDLEPKHPSVILEDLGLTPLKNRNLLWQPEYQAASFVVQAEVQSSGAIPLQIYYAWYHGARPEQKLVSSVNRLFQKENWAVIHQQKIAFESFDIEASALLLTNAVGMRAWIVYWYDMPDLRTASTVRARLWQTLARLTGRDPSGAVLAFWVPMLDQEVELKVVSEAVRTWLERGYQKLREVP